MKKETLSELFAGFSKKQADILLKKNSDYADVDALSNFKFAGQIAGISAEQQCLSLIAVKVARLGVLLKGKEPKNESVSDSILDLANYAFLLFAIMDETKPRIHDGGPFDFLKQ